MSRADQFIIINNKSFRLTYGAEDDEDSLSPNQALVEVIAPAAYDVKDAGDDSISNNSQSTLNEA